jgi:hypothetical protein
LADIFREVDEDIRRERYAKLWKAYGRYVIATAVAIVIATAATIGWREFTRSQREADGARFAVALDLARGGNSAEAAAAFAQVAEDAGGEYAALAQLQAAANLVFAGDVDGAIAAYDRLAEDRSADRILRDLSALLAVIHSFDRADSAELAQRLEPLVGGDNPWRYSARELNALAAYKAGNHTAAREGFAALVDDVGAPQGVRSRSVELLAAIGGGE